MMCADDVICNQSMCSSDLEVNSQYQSPAQTIADQSQAHNHDAKPCFQISHYLKLN